MGDIRVARPRVLRCIECGRPRFGRSGLCTGCLHRDHDDYPAPTEQEWNGPLICERDCTICGRVHDSTGEFCPRCCEGLARELDEWIDR